jgi:hypothetical protein
MMDGCLMYSGKCHGEKKKIGKHLPSHATTEIAPKARHKRGVPASGSDAATAATGGINIRATKADEKKTKAVVDSVLATIVMPYSRPAGTFVSPQSSKASARNGGKVLTTEQLTAARVDPKFTDRSYVLISFQASDNHFQSLFVWVVSTIID